MHIKNPELLQSNINSLRDTEKYKRKISFIMEILLSK